MVFRNHRNRKKIYKILKEKGKLPNKTKLMIKIQEEIKGHFLKRESILTNKKCSI